MDFLIVGSGLTGAVIARQLTGAGYKCLVVDKRDRVAGNCADTIHECGQRYNLYGPHYFRTDSEDIWKWANRYAEFNDFRAVVKAMIGGVVYPWPVSQEYIDARYPNWKPVTDAPTNFKEVCLTKMPEKVYRDFVEGYTRKQWGRDPDKLDASLAYRVEVRKNRCEELSLKNWQGVPKDGYSAWIEEMLRGIPVELGVDYLNHRDAYQPSRMTIYTGAIDAYFGYSLGKLEYRSQRRTHSYMDFLNLSLPSVQLNYPHPKLTAIRDVEWKWIWYNPHVKGTLVTTEYPQENGEEYPVPDKKNRDLYAAYRTMADKLSDVLICGRLGENKYLDMDQTLGRALMLSERLIQ